MTILKQTLSLATRRERFDRQLSGGGQTILNDVSWRRAAGALEVRRAVIACDRRIGEPKELVCEIAAWQNQRNASRARINWQFTTEKARDKLARAYPDTSKESKLL